MVRNRSDEASALMERAQNLGIRLELDFGFVFVKKATTSDPEISAIVIEGLGEYLPEIRTLLEPLARAARAKELLGKRVWFPELRAEGTVKDVEPNGSLIVSMERTEHQPANDLMARAENLIILQDEENSDASDAAPRDDESISKNAKKSVLMNLLKGKHSFLKEK
jgi:hypothetical protein